MQRPRLLVLAGGMATVIAVGPVLGAVAIAADPTIVVQPGDTLTAISKRVNVSTADLVELNALPDPNRILAGQRLRIGSEEASLPPSVPAPDPATATGAPVVHAVERGENLTVIARRYGVTVAAIVAANGLSDPSRIYGGQTLTIPGVEAAPAPPVESAAAPPAADAVTAPSLPAVQVHTIQRGENLTVIGRRYGVTVAAIAAANGLSDPSRIYGGQTLTIPGVEAAATSAAPALAAPSMPASMAARVAARAAVGQMIAEEAATFGVPPAFAMAVAWHESGWQQGVVSSAGAVGVMQLMPATADWVGEAMLGAPVDMHDVRANVRAGVRLLAHYLARYDGNRELVLAAYYQGQRAADRHGVFAVTSPYIASILLLERLFGG